MTRLLLVIILIMLSIMAAFPAITSAAIDLPDVSFVVNSVKMYQSVLEVYDQLYICKFDVAYTDPLDAPDILSDYYIARLVDGAVNIGSIRPWGLFDAAGECNWFFAIYITPAELTALGYDPTTDGGATPGYGDATGWQIKFEGDPALDWTGGTPPSTFVDAVDIEWNDSISTATTSDALTEEFISMAIQYEIASGGTLDLIEYNSGQAFLTATGETYFVSTIISLYAICPDLFAAVIESADFEDKDFVKDYYLRGENADQTIYGVNWMAQTWQPSASYDISGLELYMYRVGLPGYVTVALRDTTTGSLSSWLSIAGSLSSSLTIGGSLSSSLLIAAGGTGPTTTNLVWGTINGDQITTNTSGNYYTVAFTTDYTLIRGHTYAFVVFANNGDVNNYVNIKFNNAGEYGQGSVYTSVNSGVTWTSVLTSDMIWAVVSKQIISDTYPEKLENKQTGRFDDLAEDWGISALWIGFLVWTFCIGLLGYYASKYTEDYNIVLPLGLVMYPIGGFIGLVSWYLVIVMVLLLGLMSFYYFTRGMPG